MLYRILILLLFAASTTMAQPVTLNPIRMHEGLPAARAKAIELLAADAVPVFVGAVGNSTVDAGGGMMADLRFHPEDGRSSAWAFSFYSPSLKQRALVAAVDIPNIGLQAFQSSSPVTIPELTSPIDMTLSHAASDAMMAQLRRDTIYSRYQSEFPGTLPDVIALRMPDGDDATIVPSWFPLDRPVWVLRYGGGGSRAKEMICYVAAGTGVTFCARAAAASAPEESRGMRRELMKLSMRGR